MHELLTKYLLFLSSAIALTLFSCKKERGDFLADISISLASEETYEYDDVLSFSISVSANFDIQKLETAIIDLSGNQMIAGPTFRIDAKNKIIEGTLQLNDRYMPSGDFFLACYAFDEDGNKDFEKKTFSYQELPKTFLGIVSSHQAFSGFSNFYLFSASDNSWSNVFNKDITCYDLQYNERFESLVVPGNTYDGIQGFSPFSGQNTGTTFFPFDGINPVWNDSYIMPEDGSYVFACKDGTIRVVRPNGNPLYVIDAPDGFIPKHVVAVRDRILVYCSNDIGTLHRLVMYNSAGGFFIDTYNLLSPITQMEAISDDRIWVYQPQEEYPQSIFEVEAFYMNVWTNFRLAPNTAVLHSIKCGQNMVVFHTDGLRKYTSSGNVVGGPTTMNDFTDWAEDTYFNRLWILLGNSEIKALSLTDFSEVASIDAPLPMQYIEVMYNK